MTTTKTATMRDGIDAMTAAALGDEHRAALAAADQAVRMTLELPSLLANPHPDPITTGTVTPKWLDAEAARLAAADDRARRWGILTSLARDARAHAEGIRTSRADAVLSGLNDLLAGLVAEVRDLADQMGDEVTTITAAVKAGHGNLWQRLDQLAADYADIRDAQQRTMSIPGLISARPADDTGDPVASDLIASNLDEIWPHWRRPHLDPTVRVVMSGPPPQPQPWPDDETEQLLWLACHAELWVPTSTQLADLQRERQARANANAKDGGVIRPHGDRFTERTTTDA